MVCRLRHRRGATPCSHEPIRRRWMCVCRMHQTWSLCTRTGHVVRGTVETPTPDTTALRAHGHVSTSFPRSHAINESLGDACPAYKHCARLATSNRCWDRQQDAGEVRTRHGMQLARTGNQRRATRVLLRANIKGARSRPQKTSRARVIGLHRAIRGGNYHRGACTHTHTAT